MKLSDFSYLLPPELIAQYPSAERRNSRLLHLNKVTGEVTHHAFSDLIHFLRPNDLLVFNDTRVFPARLYGQKKTGGKIEILIERIVGPQEALAHIRSSHAPKVGAEILLFENPIPCHSSESWNPEDAAEFQIKNDGIPAYAGMTRVVGRQEDLFKLHFPNIPNLLALLKKIGHIPLPPYIERSDDKSDAERYQTVYSKTEGSVAAPTAGLHYDEAMLQALRDKSVELAYLTLHVGAGTFKPVRVENITEHKMHGEYIEVSEAVCEQVRQTKARGGRVIAAGTTSCRALESASQSGEIKPYKGETSIFIYPGYEFKCIDGLQTNFHLPESTLIMLVSALAGRNNTLKAYEIAVQEKYRFFSYGDTMLII
jgi:S-adenosylmethionine:tRNA ribosyltransferase-isomerase